MSQANLITLNNPRSNAAEAFRTLRTNLIFSMQEKPIHTLLLTSCAEAEGKSAALANLAVTFAQSGHKTILVDSDLRRPTQHEIWGVENARGLTTMMSEMASMASPPLVGTGIDDLLLLPAGPAPSMPSDLLSSQRMQEVIGVLKARADYVLFDSPPVLAVSDAILLATRLDGMLLVVKSGSTRRDHVTRARQALERAHVRLIGSVLTNAPRESMGGDYN